MAKVLVTGGLGYIGSHTVVNLMESGHTPVIIDNLSNSDRDVLQKIEKSTGTSPIFYELDLCDSGSLDVIFSEHSDISGVVHFAAILLVDDSVKRPNAYYRNNLVSTINLIDACNKHNVKPIVFSSSCTVYGQPEEIPVTELSEISKPESPYGNTKIVCEQMLLDAVKAYGLHVMSLRYFNPIGAHHKGFLGEVQKGEPHHLVPYITETAIGKRDHLKVFGGDYDTRDGSCVRDYIHVEDIAEAHVKSLQFLWKEETPHFTPVNLGSGQGQTVLEMIAAFEEATGIKINHQIVDRRPGDVEKVYANIELAQKLLAWQPKRSLKEMLLSAWEWQKN